MCTAITLASPPSNHFFGRTMDFSYPIDPHLYVLPQNHRWTDHLHQCSLSNQYCILGIGQQIGDLFGLFDGINEKGFAAAALYFAGYAEYVENAPGQRQVASLDFLQYILGNCGSLDELEPTLQNLSIVGLPDPVTRTAAPLHWMAADRSGRSVVIEQTRRGLDVFENPIGVLANSPDFLWQLTNLRNYVGVTANAIPETHWGTLPLRPFGQAAGTSPLPGGYTSPARFVRTTFLKQHLPVPRDPAEAAVSCFHLMESVSIPRGAVLSERGTDDYTRYTAFMNTHTCEYFFTTYENPQITTVNLWDYYYRPAPVSLGSLVRPLRFASL